MKGIFVKLLQGLFSSPQVAIKFKDGALGSESEHLVRTINYIDKKRLNLYGKTIIDIGAASGETTVYFSQIFPEHAVIGFEPTKAEFEKAKKMTAPFKKILIHQVAIADRNGQGHVHLKEEGHGAPVIIDPEKKGPPASTAVQEKEVQEVTISTLDSVYSGTQPVLLLKVDTRGTELSVLKGAVNTLSLTKLVLIEMNTDIEREDCSAYFEVDEFLRTHNFRLKDLFVTRREDGEVKEYHALYENPAL
jgi:FkbM family methyltransferase